MSDRYEKHHEKRVVLPVTHHTDSRADSPADCQSDPTPAPPRFLSEPECRALIARILHFTNGRDATDVLLDSTWNSSVRWARNRASIVADAHETTVGIVCGNGRVELNQTDDVSLAAGVRWAEKLARLKGDGRSLQPFAYAPPKDTFPKTHIWSDTTYAMTSAERTQVANALMIHAEQVGMQSAGYLNLRAGSKQLRLIDGRMCYARFTQVECSLTVRDPQNGGSGWAGASSYDWAHIDAHHLAEIALDKCLRSRNPVRIEPGRYTVILEPQATYDLIKQVMGGIDGIGNLLGRPYMEWDDESRRIPSTVQMPFYDHDQLVQLSKWGPPHAVGVTKIGQRLLDPRLSITFDPEDERLGGLPFTERGEPYVPVTWWQDGVLKNLAYRRGQGPNPTALRAQPNGRIFRMSSASSGGQASIAEMIATTDRGLLVTRFWDVTVLDRYTILCTGMTRDGLWLIEHGKISHPVKNLRFTESPLFVFNQVDAVGVPVPVFAPGLPAIVPPMKVRDFSFTSLVDAT